MNAPRSVYLVKERKESSSEEESARAATTVTTAVLSSSEEGAAMSRRGEFRSTKRIRNWRAKLHMKRLVTKTQPPQDGKRDQNPYRHHT